LFFSAAGVPILSTFILGRIVWSTWRLWKMEAYAASLWLQVLTLTPGMGAVGGSGSSSGGGSSSSGGYGSSGPPTR
jgi:uncharacterized membrane protein YgcG